MNGTRFTSALAAICLSVVACDPPTTDDAKVARDIVEAHSHNIKVDPDSPFGRALRASIATAIASCPNCKLCEVHDG